MTLHFLGFDQACRVHSPHRNQVTDPLQQNFFIRNRSGDPFDCLTDPSCGTLKKSSSFLSFWDKKECRGVEIRLLRFDEIPSRLSGRESRWVEV
ncbi:hypothetical protein AVEN_259115-1 [Araneus ventricosus]|uniref:Uncharacterized protein n=1 Tax=Araneus ventricosus TaxID=182803 RepID=A0A4Y2LAW2_ARAVE|nr:hypothetical protein AVEN_259115-1 [Araneus ventricosus]